MSIEQHIATKTVGFRSDNNKVDNKIEKTKIGDNFIEQLKLVEKYSYRQVLSENSECEICNKQIGDSEITSHDMSYIFPSDYRHYMEEHNIHPPNNFYDYVMNFTEPTPIEFADFIYLMLDDIDAMNNIIRTKDEYPLKYHTVIAEIPKLINRRIDTMNSEFPEYMGDLRFST